ncbi:MAG: FliM/FliN family flagellar motor switch protein [Pseudomonadota bacterium]
MNNSPPSPSENEPNNVHGIHPVELLDHVEVECEALLGSGQLTIGRLGKLTKGDIITLDKSPADPVDIRVNGKVIARGEIVTVEDRFAIRLSQIG